MAPECRFILPTGRKCRCAATRRQDYCRHHAPKPAAPGPPPPPKRDLYSRLSHWAQVSRNVPWIDPSEIPFEIHTILRALLDNGISDREAGRLLRGLLLRLGEVPFPIPEPADAQPNIPGPALPGPNAPPTPPAAAAGRALPTPEFLASFLASLAPEGLFPPGPARAGMSQPRPGMPQPQPPMRQPQPGPHQPRLAMMPAQPRAK
jgi:hypothetical protein